MEREKIENTLITLGLDHTSIGTWLMQAAKTGCFTCDQKQFAYNFNRLGFSPYSIDLVTAILNDDIEQALNIYIGIEIAYRDDAFRAIKRWRIEKEH